MGCPTDDPLQLIDTLDLTSVKEKLRRRKGWWWCLFHDPDALEREYRQFLYLIALDPGQTVVPWSDALDEFWHEHILDTRKYEEDCVAIFGRLVHHNPHLSAGSQRQRLAFRRTLRRYAETYGVVPPSLPARSHGGPCAVFVMVGGTHMLRGSEGATADEDPIEAEAGGDGAADGTSCGSSCGSSCGGGGGCGGN